MTFIDSLYGLAFFSLLPFFFSLFQPVPHLSHSTIYIFSIYIFSFTIYIFSICTPILLIPPFSNFSFYPILYFPSLFVFSLFMSKPSSIPRVFPPNAEFETTMGPNGRDLIFFSPACVPLTFRVPRSACHVSRVTRCITCSPLYISYKNVLQTNYNTPPVASIGVVYSFLFC